MTPHANAMLRYFAQHYEDRRLPWRRPSEPLVRLAIVEGLLAVTQAVAVAKVYDLLFDDITKPEHWLDLHQVDRAARLADLEIGDRNRNAVDAIAQAMLDGVTLWPAALESQLGLGPYAAGMIGLLYGAEAAPVNAEIERVGQRAANDGDLARWIKDLVRAARCRGHSQVGYAPAYEVINAVLDVGATKCLTTGVACARCPLGAFCMSGPQLVEHRIIVADAQEPQWIPRNGHLRVRVINVDVEEWIPHNIVLEAGWRESIFTVSHGPGVEETINEALRKRFGRATTGQVDLRGTEPFGVAQQVADQLPGEHPWCRFVLGEGVGTITAWGHK